MLDLMRKQTGSYIIYLIFGAIIVVFAINFGPGGGSCTPGQGPYAALVDGETIPQQAFALRYRNQAERYRRSAVASGMEFDAAMIERMGLRKQVIDQLIDKKLLAHEAKRRGLTVSKRELRDYLSSQYRVKDVTYEQYEGWVTRSFQTSVTEFEGEVRDDILGQKLERFIGETVSVSDAELKADYLRDHDRAMITYVKVDTADIEAPEPSKAEVTKLLTERMSDVEEAYNRDILKYRTPQMVTARQIVRKLPQDASDADVAKARSELIELKEEIEGGADFAALAKQKSDDTTTKNDGGNMGTFKRGQHPKEIDDAVFALEKDELTAQPVRTSLGLHLIQVTEIIPPSRKKLDDVKTDVAKGMLTETEKNDAAKAEAEALLAELQAGADITTLTISEAESREQPTATKPVRRDSPWILASQKAIPRVGQSDELHAEIFALTLQAPVAKQVHEVGRSFYVVVLKDRETPDLAKFEADKDSLRENAIWAKRSRLFRDWVAHLRVKAKITYNPSLFPPAGEA